MSISEALLPEFDREMSVCRKYLERVPNDKWDWKPHEKSMTMGKLAMHLAEIASWVGPTLEQDSLDLDPVDGPKYAAPKLTSSEGVVELLDKNVSASRAALSKTPDTEFAKPWTLLAGGKKIFTQSKGEVFRGFVLSHAIHHRAQLGVYLRLNNVPVPSAYGPTADEPGM